MKNIIYVRVSTDDQNCDLQRKACLDWCAAKGITNYEIIEDNISGAKTSRPGFDQVMKQVRSGCRVSRIICYKMDRIGRSLIHLAVLLEEFATNGVAVVFVSQNIDTSDTSPTGTLQLHVLMAFAQFERAIINERVTAGVAAAKARGVKFGRKPKHGVTPQLVGDMRARGMSFYEISKVTGVNRGTIHRLAKQDPS